MRWNTRIIIEFDRVKEFAETICEKNHIRRVNYRPEGYLSEVLSREQILSVVREIIKTEDQTSTLQRAFYWAGILDDESSVPLIKNAIEKNRCDSSDLRVAQRALIMLKIAPEQLYKLVESSIGDDDLLKIELYWYFCYYAGQSGEFPEQFSADAIVKDVTASVDTEYWPVLTDQLNFLQGQGANAAPLFDALVSENPGRSVYYPHFALWLEKAANLQSLSAIFAKPEEYEAFIRYLIYRSFLEPEKYSFLIPVVTSSAQALLKAELQSSTMWAVTPYIHANLPGEMINVEEYRKADDWTQRLAAYLILLGTDPSIDLQEAYLQEEDSDVKIIIQLCIWLQNPEEFSGELDRFVRSQLPELEYGLPEVLSTRFATLPAVKDNPVLKAEIMFLSITDNSSVTTLEEAGPLYIRRLLKNNLIDGTDFSGSENRKSFFFSQMLYKINISFHAHELEQMIVHATDSSEAEIIFRLVNFHEIPITASSALILEKFIYSENPVILPDELPELLPFLFNDGRSAVYQSNMVTAILPYLQTDPLLAARVYDHVLMDTDVHIEVLKTLRPLPGNSRVTFLSRIVAGETVGWKELLDISYSKLNGSYEDIPGMPEALIRCLKSEDVPSDIALFFLDKLFALNDASYFAESMELLRQHGGEASVRSYI